MPRGKKGSGKAPWIPPLLTRLVDAPCTQCGEPYAFLEEATHGGDAPTRLCPACVAQRVEQVRQATTPRSTPRARRKTPPPESC